MHASEDQTSAEFMIKTLEKNFYTQNETFERELMISDDRSYENSKRKKKRLLRL